MGCKCLWFFVMMMDWVSKICAILLASLLLSFLSLSTRFLFNFIYFILQLRLEYMHVFAGVLRNTSFWEEPRRVSQIKVGETKSGKDALKLFN